MRPSPALPLIALVTFLVLDGAIARYGRRGAAPWWVPHGRLALRPLQALALVNAYFRVQPWSRFKFNVATFPLYANGWPEMDTGWAARILRLLVAVGLAASVIACLSRALRPERRIAWLGGLWLALVAAQFSIALASQGWAGPLRAWRSPGKAYAYSAGRVHGVVTFLAHFEEVFPRLDLHARTHPAGATLLAYCVLDAGHPTSRANPIRVLALAGLNVAAAFFLAKTIFRDDRTAVAAAALMGAMPAAAAHDVYSLDPLFAVVFDLYLLSTWLLVQRTDGLVLVLAAGVVLFVLSMLTFSWSIVAAAVALFSGALGGLRRLPLRRLVLIETGPPVIALSLHILLRWIYGFDYIASYRLAYEFARRTYTFSNAHDWVVALIGGQVELLVGVGPLVAAIFVLGLRERARRWREPFSLLLGSILFCYSLAIVFGVDGLKLELSRAWYWMATMPVLVAADRLSRAHPKDDRPILLAAAASLATAIGLLLFLDFGA